MFWKFAEKRYVIKIDLFNLFSIQFFWMTSVISDKQMFYSQLSNRKQFVRYVHLFRT
jgi:uncharacterized protein YegJ (DUF2314 family)